MSPCSPRGSRKPSTLVRAPLHTRKQLVRLVKSEEVSIRQAARRLNIKDSTAKRIMKRFNRNGSFYENRKMKRERIIRQRSPRPTKNNDDLVKSSEAVSSSIKSHSDSKIPSLRQANESNSYPIRHLEAEPYISDEGWCEKPLRHSQHYYPFLPFNSLFFGGRFGIKQEHFECKKE